VHWPLIVYVGYIFGQGSQAAGAKLAVFVLAIVLSELMYRYVETPFRSRNTSLLPVAGYAAALIAVIASVAFIANRQDGWPWRLSPEARQMADLQRFGFWPCTRSAQSACAFGAVNERLGVQLIGDSFAEQFVAARLQSGSVFVVRPTPPRDVPCWLGWFAPSLTAPPNAGPGATSISR
jgi:hypothetical protein